MNIKESFDNFYNEIHLNSTATFDNAINAITKKLNLKYYPNESEDDSINVEVDNSLIVGSIGRGTAIENVSDVDLLFILPWNVYDRFSAYKNNGQSALLQEIKAEILERYPRTDIKGDGQAVVIEFEKFSIDLVPAFKNTDGSFLFPNSNNGGSWENTNPIPEQRTSKDINNWTNNNFVQLANMMRCWKDNNGFIFGGLLIDTLVYYFLNQNSQFWYSGFGDYVDIITKLLKYLSEKKENEVIYALGSYKTNTDKGHGKYIIKAKEYYDQLINADKEYEIENVFVSMFGNKFRKSMVDSKGNQIIEDSLRRYGCVNTEEFIEDRCPVDIRYYLRLNCNVTINGWRPKLLRSLFAISLKRKLEFYIEKTNVPKPYKIYWKVRNVGPEAYGRNCIRGQIYQGHETKIETSSFDGPHYVECYLIKNGICVARDRIIVNIRTGFQDGVDVI
ncbi:MAG: nucleotidyltransferase domain-containing protein [Lachnospiraceae bacterium]|nr:nucleotidyltransferase domain-containing protein [Lachnospiraceae bacterium]